MVQGPTDSTNNPASKASHGAHGAKSKADAAAKASAYTSKDRTFLKMHFTAEQWNKLMNAVATAFVTVMKHQQDNALKAIKKLGKEDPNADDDN